MSTSDASALSLGEIVMVDIPSLKPSPENDELYGRIDIQDKDFKKLVKDVRSNGIREPLVVTQDRYVLSGHRRLAAAQFEGLTSVPVRFASFCRDDILPVDYQRRLREFNLQRVKTPQIRLREAALDINPDIAYRELLTSRDEERVRSYRSLVIQGEKHRSEISAAKMPMLLAAKNVIFSLRQYWPLSVRQVHYQLLNFPPLRNSKKSRSIYKNDRNSYQDLCDLLTRARLAGSVPFEAIHDETRPTSFTNFDKDAADFFENEFHDFLRCYRRDLLQDQFQHVELIVEKLTVQSIVRPIAYKYCVPLTVGRGYCSLEPRRAIVERFEDSLKEELVLLFVSDLDPDGDEIAASFARSIRDDFGVDVDSVKILLTREQVDAWELKSNGLDAKPSSANYEKFVARYGTKEVFELESVSPTLMQKTIADAIESVIDLEAFNDQLKEEKKDAVRLAAAKKHLADAAANLSFD